MTWGTQAAQTLAETLGGWFAVDGVAAATAAVDASETVIASHPPDLPADARFEIGSITKTMTATVLAALVADGALGLDDPIGRWLSAGQNSGITVRELATHTSGLPAVAPNRQAVQDAQSDPANPWAGYTFERAEEGLRLATVTPGNPWRYSNLGYQLLGLIVQRASGTDYPELLAERLLAPLAMTHPGVGQRGAGTLLPGHAGDREAPRWDHPWGAGGVEATIADLARYARACLFVPDTPLGAAIRRAQQPLLPRGPGSRQGLAWVVEDDDGICWHTGGTGGFCACVMIDHGHGRAVAALLSYGGTPAYSSRVKQVAQLALAGTDPRQAPDPEPWPSWRADAQGAVRALLTRDFDRVHARLAPQRREQISVKRLETAWQKFMPNTAPQADIAVVQHEIAASGTVIALIAITTPDASRRLRLVILPTGELGGLSLAPPA